jgi:ubiquinone/menaquinone biosynthesis C-methylase UbiE
MSEKSMNPANEWANSSRLDAQAAALAARLEDRARCPDQKTVNSALVRVLSSHPGERWLEVGCGSGVLCRLTAPEIAPLGQVTGVDLSPKVLPLANQIAQDSGLAETISFGAGEGERLPFRAGTFDCVFAARLLLHVSNPQSVIHEMARVTKPWGRVVVMDWDFETVTVDHPNRELTRRLLHWRTDHEGGDNWSGRKLWRYMRDAGLAKLSLKPVVSVARSDADSLFQSLWKAAQVACEGGAITPGEQAAWTNELQESLATGRFLASIVYFIVSGERL